VTCIKPYNALKGTYFMALTAQADKPAPATSLLQTEPQPLLPTVSALICTRNRGDSLIPTVRSILRPQNMCIELVVIDQSSDCSTEQALRPFLSDPRLRYIRTETRGKGIALNLGLEECRGEIVAITDDDCEVGEQWPAYHVEAFQRYPRLAITYGNVLPVEHDPGDGFIPTYFVTKDRLCTNMWQKLTARGIGANTAVRRKEVLALGGFDPELCPGGIFKACVDRDLTVRCLLAGYYIFEACDSVVYHYGFRTWEQGRILARNAFYGIGAAHAKPLKCGRLDAMLLLLWELGAYAIAPSIKATLTLSRPLGWGRVFHFLRGVKDGLNCPVDRKTMLYVGATAMASQEALEKYHRSKVRQTASASDNSAASGGVGPSAPRDGK
jgi:GT2 family glycosyltransferase